MKIIFSLILACLTYVAYSQLDGSYQNLVNRPEAKGLDVSIYVPDGWFFSAEREDGPISLSNSTGSDVIFITIKRLPTFYSRRMSNEIFRGEEYVQTLTEELKGKYGKVELISSKIISVSTYPALYADFKIEVQRIEAPLFLDLHFVQVFYEDYGLTFGLTSELIPEFQRVIETIRFENENK